MLRYIKTKLLLLLIIIPNIGLAEHAPYFKGVIGINKINKLANYDNQYQKSNFSPDIGIGGGVGYILDKGFRGEILVSYTGLSFSNKSKLSSFYELSISTKKVVINSTMLNIYKDFFTLSHNVNFFLGIGAGISQITEFIIWESLLPNMVAGNNKITFTRGVTNRKIIYNFSHSVIAGIDFKVSDRINMEITYQFKNNGLTPARKMARVNVNQKLYLLHNIYTGFRYNL